MLIAIIKSFALLVALSVGLSMPQADDQTNSDEPLASATVGAPTMLRDLVVPGGELIAKPLEGDPAVIVQIVEAIPEIDSFRYTIRFSGLEPGQHDLAEWLVRKEKIGAKDIQPIFVEIESLLQSGQVTPNELQESWIPRMGGYRWIMSLLVLLWGLILLAMIFLGKGKQAVVQQTEAAPKTLADLLKERIEATLENDGDHQQHAELERMLFSMWRRRLGFESLPLDEAMAKIKADSEAGPLMTQLENWMHQPAERNRDVNLAKLLQPYRSLSVDELEAPE